MTALSLENISKSFGDVQVLRNIDLVVEPEEFVADILQGLDPAHVQEMADEIKGLVAHPHLFGMDKATIDVCRRWDIFCHKFFHAYQDLALAEVEK